jgi:ribonucleoside-diphosphate reductase alpha chain
MTCQKCMMHFLLIQTDSKNCTKQQNVTHIYAKRKSRPRIYSLRSCKNVKTLVASTLMNVDHANSHGSFKPEVAPIRQSNLCCEIDLPTKPLKDINDPEGEIALCTLSAINWGSFRSPEEMEKACTLAVRGLDALLSYQNYPILAAELATQNRRPLGVGIINLAYWLAKNDVSYTDPAALPLVDRWAQHWSYYLIKASADLAAEQGACPKSNETRYHDGVLPVDTYKRDVDELVPHQDLVDWAGLRETTKKHWYSQQHTDGIDACRNKSAQISNSTNGVEPPRSYVSIKQSKDGVLKQVVPEYRKLKKVTNCCGINAVQKAI